MARRSAVLLLLALGCGGERTAPAPLRVFAAASLTAAFNEIADSLEAVRPGVSVEFNFAGSQALAFQLLQGAEADVFAAADRRWMNVALDSGLVNVNPLIFAENQLTVVIPAANPGHITSL